MAEAWYQQYKNQGFMEYFVVKENASGGPPSAAYCQSVRDQYGLTMPVLMDPNNLIGQALGYSSPFNHWNIVLGPGVTLTLKQKGGSNASVQAAIESALGL